jgi:hypothetical protein
MKEYREDLLQRYWKYQESQFRNEQGLFNPRYRPPASPPVFLRDNARRNVIVNPNANEQEKKKLFGLIPKGEWHKWYGSMNSSQALAHSVLGNLAVYGFLSHLSELKDDDEGQALFGKADVSSSNFAMEHKVDCLGEPRKTSLDGYLSGDYRIAIECKFTEAEVGTCSRPRLEQADSNFESEHCDGNYSVQRRKSRCPLTEIEVKYWNFVPQLFTWQNDCDHFPCPLNKNYQLVRNVLAVGVKLDGTTSPHNGHVVLIYDNRNPAFQKGGDGFEAYEETRDNLLEPTMLRKCSWQRIAQHMRSKDILPWLTEHLTQKYGL